MQYAVLLYGRRVQCPPTQCIDSNVHLYSHISGAVSVYVLVVVMHMVLEIRLRSAEKMGGFFAWLGQIPWAPAAWASKTWLLVPTKAGCYVHEENLCCRDCVNTAHSCSFLWLRFFCCQFMLSCKLSWQKHFPINLLHGLLGIVSASVWGCDCRAPIPCGCAVHLCCVARASTG